MSPREHPLTAYVFFPDFERDPVVDPSYIGGCPNPPSTTNIKCILWGQSINTEVALNWGEKRCDFKVLIAGSNYYLKQSARQNLSDFGFFGPRGEYVTPIIRVPLLESRCTPYTRF